MAPDGNYTDDEVRAIIDHALRIQHDRDLDHQQLLAVASEVGISRENVEAAVREVQHKRESEEAKLNIRSRRRRRLMSHLWTFVAVNVFLFAINYLTSPGEWWFLFALLSWGLGLLFHARSALSSDVSDRAIRREKKRLQSARPPVAAKSLPQAKFQSGNLERGAAEFGTAVQEGVGQLLARAAAELRAAAASPRVRVESPKPGGGPRVSAEVMSQKQHATPADDSSPERSLNEEPAARRNREPG